MSSKLAAARMDRPEAEDETPRRLAVTAALAAVAAVVLVVFEDPAAGAPAHAASAARAVPAGRAGACGTPLPVAMDDRPRGLPRKE